MHKGVGIDRTAVVQMVLLQGGITLTISLLFSLVSSLHGWSSFLGGMVCMLPNVFMGLFWSRRNMRHQQAVRDLVIGESVKWLGTVGLFVCVFVLYADLQPLAFFGTFVLLLPSPLLVGLMQARKVAS